MTRWHARARGLEREFEAFCLKIEAEGYWRPWGSHSWRTIDLDSWFFWLHFNEVSSVRERTVINRWTLDRDAGRQLSLEVA